MRNCALGPARSNDMHTRHVSGEKVQGTYMPKSAITISDNGPLIRKRMFPGLFTSHVAGPEISPGGLGGE